MARLLLLRSAVKVVIAQWQGRVSPVFDSSSKALVVEVAGGAAGTRETAFIGGSNALDRSRSLQGIGTDVRICGAISRPMEVALTAAGIRVLADTCGAVDDVLRAFIDGRLGEETFTLPGTRRQKGRRS